MAEQPSFTVRRLVNGYPVGSYNATEFTDALSALGIDSDSIALAKHNLDNRVFSTVQATEYLISNLP